MANYIGNVKGINLINGFRGGEKEAVFLITFDLINQSQTGGTDTIQLGGGGYLKGVATTQTLAAMIAAQVRGAGGTFTIDWAGSPAVPGYQAGNPIYPQSAAVSGSNVGSIKTYTTPSGATGQNTTSAGWDSAAGIVVGGHFANAGT